MVKTKVIVDNTVLSNFALINREDLLNEVFANCICTSEAVLKEIQRAEERDILPKRERKWLEMLQVESEQEIRNFKLLIKRFGEGESSCLSLAVNRNMKVLTDDLDARRYAQRIGIPVSGTIGVLILAIKKGIISLEDGNHFLLEMIQKGFYSPYEKLDELLK